MTGRVVQWLSHFADTNQRKALESLLNPIADRSSSVMLGSAALVIKAGSSALVKAGAAFVASVQGVLVTKAINTDMAALSGTVANAAFNVYAFFIDSAGTLTSAMGTAGATLATVKFPPIPVGKTLIGFITINPTGTGDFVGGTTALDDGTVVPTAVYVNVQNSFDPTMLL
jgi:hypothetical protein